MQSWSDLLKELFVERGRWKRILAFAAVGLILLLAYRRYESRHRAARLEDLLLFQGVVESALSDAWAMTGRACAGVAAAGRGACERAAPRLEISPELDRQQPALEQFLICRDASAKAVCRPVQFATWVRELDLGRSYRDLLLLDASGNVLASWRGTPGGLARLEAGAAAARVLPAAAAGPMRAMLAPRPGRAVRSLARCSRSRIR